jgi:PKHD-type hydroxylase
MTNKTLTAWPLKQITDRPWYFKLNFFNDEEVEKIISMGLDERTATPLEEGSLLGGRMSSNIRSCMTSWIKSDQQYNFWLFQKLTTAINDFNSKFFNFDIYEIQSLQFTKYDASSSDFYTKHIDLAYGEFNTRKLSFTIQLSDPDDYEGGDLVYHCSGSPETGIREKGSIMIFPSYTLHEVTPVTKGTRYSLVGWTMGPAFK